ncbi:MAG: serine hydrolase domain-containing protein [Brevundimonas sp.]
MNPRLACVLAAIAIAAGVLPAATVATAATAHQIAPTPSPAMTALFDYLRARGTTGLVIIRDGQVLADETWPAPADDPIFANFVYGRTPDGALLEDVASQQKSFVAVLVAIAVDKGLIDVDQPVSTYLGQGWSRATPGQEARIRVVDVLTMSSGLDERFGHVAEPGATFFYNTPVYAVTKRILAAAAGRPLETLTHDWLTEPAGMSDTGWRRRPAALASVGNDTGLVTTPRDVARFGLMVLHGGVAEDGARVVSRAQLDALFARSASNPAYGRLWWLNGSDHTMRILGGRSEGPFIPAAPADLIGALGALDRRLYIVPSRRLVVVRTGAAAGDPGFDQAFWLRLNAVIDGP